MLFAVKLLVACSLLLISLSQAAIPTPPPDSIRDDPCAIVRCAGRCIVENGRAKCVPVNRACPDSCPADNGPVCGSDGKTYKNECQLIQSSCAEGLNVRKAHDGNCTEPSKPDKSCVFNCFVFSGPICGSDGKTYGDDCALLTANCKNGTDVKKAYSGKCKAKPTQPAKSCSRPCPQYILPFCGSDGNTYGNPCFLAIYNCQHKTNVTKVHNGACTSADSTTTTSKPKPSCVFHCPVSRGPICGSDGTTYSDDCALRSSNCEKGTDIKKAHDGRCGPPASSCNTVCPQYILPFCGSDGKTYGNPCFLSIYNCQHKTNVTKVHDGACNATDSSSTTVKPSCIFECPLSRGPICGSDGKTYSDDCALRSSNCVNGTEVQKAHDGQCGSAGKNCARPCSKLFAPLCGSNGKTFVNSCYLQIYNCQHNARVTKIRSGSCDATTKKPTPNCVFSCPLSKGPICGSDGLTYSDDCELRTQNCVDGSNIMKVRDGPCNSNPNCKANKNQNRNVAVY